MYIFVLSVRRKGCYGDVRKPLCSGNKTKNPDRRVPIGISSFCAFSSAMIIDADREP